MWRVNVVQKGLRRRLFFNSKIEAETFARQAQSEQRADWEQWLALDATERYDIMIAHTRAKTMGVKLIEAVDAFTRPAVVEGKTRGRNIRDALDACLADKEPSLRPRSFASLSSTLNRFTAHVENCGVTTLPQITPELLRAWLQSGDWAVRTQMGYLTDVATFLSYCVALDWIATNPALKLKAAMGAKRIVGKRNTNVFYTPKECSLLLDTTRQHAPEWMAFLVLGLFCGIRPEEIDRLEWANVREDTVAVSVEASKTHQARYVALRPAAKAWLEEARRLGGKLPPANRAKLMRRVRKLSGIRWGHDVLRNTFCTYSTPIWGTVETAASAGHSEQVLKAHYLEAAPKTQAESFWKIRPE